MRFIIAGSVITILTGIFPQMQAVAIGGVSVFYALGGWWIGWGIGVVQGRGWDWSW